MARKPLALALAAALAPSEAFCFDRGAPTPQSFLFAADAPASIDPAKEGKARRFEGVAYSGDVITGHWYWGNVVFDLSSTKAAQKLPMLVGHDNEKIAGFSDKVAIGKQIDVAGALSSRTQYGQDVAALSDEGFPWQMSVRIEPAQVDEIGKGKSVQVNGRTFEGPITVFRNSVIREVSFTPTGWDAQTSATAMARGNQSTDEESSMTKEEQAALEAKAAQATKFEADAKAALEAKAKAEAAAAADKAKVAEFEKAESDRKAAARSDAIKKLFEDCGIKHTPELAKPYEALDENAFAAISTQMREAAKPAAARDPKLFQEQAKTGAAAIADAQAVADKARELMFAAKEKGQVLDVVSACAKAKQLLAAA